MRILLKTNYGQDNRLFPFGGSQRFFWGLALYALWISLVFPLLSPNLLILAAVIYAIFFGALLLWKNQTGEGGSAAFWYGLLGVFLLSAPFIVSEYMMGQMIFIFIYAIAGFGLVLLAGRTGQISLGHAAFMASGAYIHALLQNDGWGLLISLPSAVILSALLGVVIGLPALRVRGVYLAFATYAFAFIVEEVLVRWESVTGGSRGLEIGFPHLVLPFGEWVFETDTSFYYLSLCLFALTLLISINILRSHLGRAFMAIRDSEIAAQSQGIRPAQIKTTAFAISAGLAGLSGALYAHMLSTLTPEAFTIFLSINLLMIVVVGGLTHLHGAVFGSIFLVVLPQILSFIRDFLPSSIGGQVGLEAMLFGLLIILFVLFEPLGIYGRWVKLKTYFDLFPLYRKGSFARQRSYMVSERNQ